ncbi:MAG: hypothetical protein AAGF47_02670 [Planctomycetota bacterium]
MLSLNDQDPIPNQKTRNGRIVRVGLPLVAALALPLAFAGCEASEDAGDEIEDAGEAVTDAAEDAGDAISDGVDEIDGE